MADLHVTIYRIGKCADQQLHITALLFGIVLVVGILTLFVPKKEAAKAVHKRLRQVEFRTQAPDHPILWAANESYYLKFYIFQVCDEK